MTAASVGGSFSPPRPTSAATAASTRSPKVNAVATAGSRAGGGARSSDRPWDRHAGGPERARGARLAYRRQFRRHRCKGTRQSASPTSSFNYSYSLHLTSTLAGGTFGVARPQLSQPLRRPYG
jgi:hypothetical protein